jgi:hypothetical protein
MKKLPPLIPDLLAVRRGELALDAVTGRISSHLTSWPQAAQEVLHEVEAAFEQRIIEPEEFQQLKTIIIDTVSKRQILADLPGAARPGSQRGADQLFNMPNRPAGGGAPAGRTNIALGTRLRERFILDEVLGVGGMGIVYKVRDLLKVEARDRNPYVAIKVLREDFKKRDDAFIMLQREASRQQRLAHPNIVTVYDFDRTGDTIFISMEFLEGTPLDVFLSSDGREHGDSADRRDVRCIDVRARARHRACRLQAEQLLRHAGRQGEGPRLRYRASDAQTEPGRRRCHRVRRPPARRDDARIRQS